jgi:hypothetical protein
MSAEANALALRRIAEAEPVLIGVARAADALNLGQGELGHAGPPFNAAADIPRPVLNALAGAAVHEGWAGTVAQARALILDGSIRLRANHDLGAVSPMAGVVRPSQMVMRVENRSGPGVAYATLAESGRQVLRFGVYNESVAEGLRWLDDALAPALARALPRNGLPVFPLVADGVALGDDVHQRNIGGMMAFIRALGDLDASIRRWLFANPQHFLNYAMAAAKLALDRADGVAGSSIVTAITRNGVACGIRVSGAGRRWFTAPATAPVGGFFPPFSLDDAQADLGDSAIMEAYGLGGAIAHASPEIAKAMGRPWDEAVQAGQAMREFFIGRHPTIAPALCGVAGVGLGLDAALVVEADRAVRIHTGIGHKDGQTGWIGVGVAEAPVACFAAALKAIEEGP